MILPSASATASGRGPIIITSELGLGHLLLDLGLLERLVRHEELLLGDLATSEQRTEPIGGLLGLGHRHLGLLDGELGGPPLLGRGEAI